MANWVEELTPESKIFIQHDNGNYEISKVGNNLLVLDGIVIGIFHNKLIQKHALLNDSDCPIKQYTLDVYFKLIAIESKQHKVKYVESNIHHLLIDPICVDTLLRELAIKGRLYDHPKNVKWLLKPDFDANNIPIEYSDLNVSSIDTTGILIQHIPTGISAQSTNERSSHKNRDVAMRLLRVNIIKQLLSN